MLVVKSYHLRNQETWGPIEAISYQVPELKPVTFALRLSMIDPKFNSSKGRNTSSFASLCHLTQG